MADDKPKPAADGKSKKGSSVKGNTGQSKSPTRVTKFCETMSRLACVINEAKGEVEDIMEAENILVRQKVLEKELEDKQAEIEHLKQESEATIQGLKNQLQVVDQAHTMLIKSFEKRCSDFSRTEDKMHKLQGQLQGHIENLTAQFEDARGKYQAARQEADVATQDLTLSNVEVGKLRKTLHQKTLDCKVHESALANTNAALSKVKNELNGLRDEVGLTNVVALGEKELSEV